MGRRGRARGLEKVHVSHRKGGRELSVVCFSESGAFCWGGDKRRPFKTTNHCRTKGKNDANSSAPRFPEGRGSNKPKKPARGATPKQPTEYKVYVNFFIRKQEGGGTRRRKTRKLSFPRFPPFPPLSLSHLARSKPLSSRLFLSLSLSLDQNSLSVSVSLSLSLSRCNKKYGGVVL